MSRQILAQAAQQAKAGRLDQAIESLKTLLQQEPEHELALGMLGGIYAQLGMHERAVSQFEKVLARNPDQPLARLQLGITLIELHRYAEAVDALAPLRDAGEYTADFYSALALMQCGRAKEAEPLLERAAAKMPADHPFFPELQELLNTTKGGTAS